MSASALEFPSLQGKVSPEEWAVRVDLAAAYRLVSRYGWERVRRLDRTDPSYRS